MFNRYGAQNVNGTIYALKRDVVSKDGASALTAGNVRLRADKRPRPLTLRMAEGECLSVTLTNLLDPASNPNNADPDILTVNNQVAGRYVGFNPIGLPLADSIADDASYVGENANSLVGVGETRTFRYYGEEEGPHVVLSSGAAFGGQASGGNTSNGLWGTVVVEPAGARYYRSAVTEEELRLASTGQTTPEGHPVIDYDARYPDAEPWISEGKAGLPILSLLDGDETVHNEWAAIVAGPNDDGSFPALTYPLESQGLRNPALPSRLEAFRENVAVFHDEVVAAQAFPNWFGDPVFSHTLHGVADSFMINYGSGGIGSEVIANRLGVGPAHDCLSCAYEEFFLSAFTAGDPAMVVDVPANTGLEHCAPDGSGCDEAALGPKATAAFYPEDPANVFHSYLNDPVKFRGTHAGPKEHHVFHLHNHQWLYNADDDNSNYLDAQALGPGSAYTFEIAFGGSGNRNQSAGDAIYHCHFYPHFAQGMWALWRIHDVFEAGTKLAASMTDTGFHDDPFELAAAVPAPGSRALPDGEITAGAPIPAIVPLPGKALPPIPGKVQVVAVDKDGDGTPESSQALLDPSDTDPALVDTRPVVASADPNISENQLNPTGLRNPGYPFWIAGIDATVGQRPPTPPLDMLAEAGGWDGGLPRHTLDGYAVGGVTHSHETRTDFSKGIDVAKAHFLPELGTPFERAAMAFHARREHDTSAIDLVGGVADARFVTNGQLPTPGAPYFEPCRDDRGELVVTGQTGHFWGATDGGWFAAAPDRGADNPRVYKAANIQTDVVFNKVGYHFPQQRILALWEDVLATLDKTRAPEPFVMRLNTTDCAVYLQTNLVPSHYELDDYQVRTTTDVIGQHIHLPKWDLVSSDGAGNGWNYEDGVLAAETVIERIEAINAYNDLAAPGTPHLAPEPHYYADFQRPEWLGARTGIQRWFVDPLFNTDGEDRGLGITFTHDHFAPSTHQQVGLYATLLIAPKGSTYVHNETGEPLHVREDGGPTSWQAVVQPGDIDGDGAPDDYREFYFEFADFQHAYEAGAWVGVDENGDPTPPTTESFRDAVNPSVRKRRAFPDLVEFPPTCPGGVPRPCPEAISAADPGMYVVNYRNEPIAHRVFDPEKLGPDGKTGMQADGLGGDLAFAFASRTDRAIPELNADPSAWRYGPITGGLSAGDPFTPLVRAVDGDIVKIRAQTGAHEEEHTTNFHGVKWLRETSSFGRSANSGWKASEFINLSEKFSFSMPLTRDLTQTAPVSDHLYSFSAGQRGIWSGNWGIMRAYDVNQPDLVPLASNDRTQPVSVRNRRDFDGVCPIDAPVHAFDVTAVAINDVTSRPANVSIIPDDDSATMHVGGPLDPDGGSLVYNNRVTSLQGGESGPIHDPTALLYVFTEDLEPRDNLDRRQRITCTRSRRGSPIGPYNMECPVKLKDDVEPKPLVMRAPAGACISVTLRNRLPEAPADLAGYTTTKWIVKRDRGEPGEAAVPFENNLIRPSAHVGMHPQLVEYDVTAGDGANVGQNPTQTAAPGEIVSYKWYAGDITTASRRINRDTGLNAGAVDLVATPVEFGTVNLQPADKLKHGQKGMFGMLVIQPEGATWTEDGGESLSATVTKPDGQTFRDHVVMWHKAVNARYADGTPIEMIGIGEGGEPEPENASTYAINYRTEPMWFRYRMLSRTPFGRGGGLGDVADSHEAFSNVRTGGADPQTPVWTSPAGMESRLRVGMPWGVGRGIVFGMQGHGFQRNPYLSGAVPSQTIGNNPTGMWANTIEGVLTGAHHNVVVEAGGPAARPGDYLLRDFASIGMTNGLWGLFRVLESDAVASAE
jgi:hypothetical protein